MPDQGASPLLSENTPFPRLGLRFRADCPTRQETVLFPPATQLFYVGFSRNSNQPDPNSTLDTLVVNRLLLIHQSGGFEIFVPGIFSGNCAPLKVDELIAFTKSACRNNSFEVFSERPIVISPSFFCE